MDTVSSVIQKTLLGNFAKEFAANYPNVDQDQLKKVIKGYLDSGVTRSGTEPPPAVHTKAKSKMNTSVVPKNGECGPPLVIIDRDPVASLWIIKGTQYVIKSASDTTVIGKVRMNKCVPLSNVEIQECKKKGLVVIEN